MASDLRLHRHAGRAMLAAACAAVAVGAHAALSAASYAALPAASYAASPAALEAGTLPKNSPSQELQIIAVSVVVRAEPKAGALAMGEVQRGTLLKVLAHRGDWYQVALSAGASGWVQRVPAEYGQMSIEIFDTRIGLHVDDAGDAGDAGAGAGPGAEAGIIAARPVGNSLLVVLPPIDPLQVAPPLANLPRESIPVPDRWRLMQALGFKFPWYDPYNQNPLKGDLPVLQKFGPDLFFTLGVVSDTLFEFSRLPTPTAGQVALRPGANDVFGGGRRSVFVQNVILSLGLNRGATTFRPPDIELRFVPVFSFNRAQVQEAGALNIDPSRGTRRTDQFLGIQELFVDQHLRNVSVRYDFDSIRIGIQPFTNDFRGFLFQDSPFGIRLFGNRDNNRFQYNLAWLRRIEKDTNSGLNDLGKGLRHDDLLLANLYRQDWPVPGFTSQISVVHNRNRENRRAYDDNGFLIRPAFIGDLRAHRYQVTYLGFNGDGHFGKWNLSTSTYGVLGNDTYSPIAHRSQKIRAAFHASELSRDFNWLRLRANLLLASGDKDPFDDKSTGFDAILENPQFAGADTAFSIRQGLPLIGGGGVALSGRNGILPSLRSSKDEGQSNFLNPGLILLGVGVDADVLPQLRVFGNVSGLRFMDTSILAALRTQPLPSKSLGTDFSAGFHWRPYFNQNLVINGSVAALRPGAALKALYGDKQGTLYSALLNVVVAF